MTMSQSSIIVAGYPGVGKSFSANTRVPSGYRFLDLDPAPFSRAPDFPENYMREIRKAMKNPNLVIMVGVHAETRRALVAEGIPFTLVYPDTDLKEEYMKRWADRGSPVPFIKKMETEWYNFTRSCREQAGCKHVVLHRGQFLSDSMRVILGSEGC